MSERRNPWTRGAWAASATLFAGTVGSGELSTASGDGSFSVVSNVLVYPTVFLPLGQVLYRDRRARTRQGYR